LIRHGQASFGQQNYDQLSPLGELQASKLGEALLPRVGSFDLVCMGSMYRHQQTAELCLSQKQEDTWITNPGWNEYDHQDILAQLSTEFETALGIQSFVKQQSNPKAAFEKLFNDAMNRWMSPEHDDDYVESWTDYQSRIKQAFNDLLDTHKEAKKIAVFTSGGPISVISQFLLAIPANNIMQLNWTLVNCGITKVISTGNRLFVSSLNEHSHFEGPDIPDSDRQANNKKFITYK
jgi:broad specificity phosphatase PhoE